MQHDAWPRSPADLIELQRSLGAQQPDAWQPGQGTLTFGACFVCFERGSVGAGRPGDQGWAAAVAWRDGEALETALASGPAGSGYEAGLLALREGPLLAAAVAALQWRADVLIVDATGRDHPRRAGLALQLGWAFGFPSVGVTHRTLLAAGDEPGSARGDRRPFTLHGDVVGYWLRTKAGTRPLAIHAGWRMEPSTAVDVVGRCLGSSRTPEPLRAARHAAREARAAAARV